MRVNALRLRNRKPAALLRPRGAQYPRLRYAVVAVWISFLVFCLYRLTEEPFAAVAGAVVIATVALLPAYLWANGAVPGLPILPLNTLTFLWTHGLPLVVVYDEISSYDATEILFSTACVALYCVVATMVWAAVATGPVVVKRVRFYVLPRHRGFTFFLAAVCMGGLFVASEVGGWFAIDASIYGIVRSSILAFTSVAFFVLSIRLGRGELRPAQRGAFLAAAAFFVVCQISTLYLIGAIISMASALIGYTIGRGKVPWAAIAAALVVFGFLHSGKGEMRERYWAEDSPRLSMTELPGFFSEWIVAGTRELSGSEKAFGSQPIYERVGLMHLLLFVQRQSPDVMPYLEGATYAFIPQLLVPRLIDPDKPHSHLGTAMLNVHYGIQSEEDTERTTVAWGLLNEAYANFGLAGVAGLAVFTGLLFGFAGRLTVGAPVMSLEIMFGVTVAALAIQSEFTMGVFVTVLFQSVVVLLLVTPFLELRRAGDAA